MTRPKTTINFVADALGRLQAAKTELQSIDLRTTRGALRDQIRDARVETDKALASCQAAIQADASQLAASRRAS